MQQMLTSTGPRHGLRALQLAQFAAGIVSLAVIIGAVLWSGAQTRDAVDRLLRVHGQVAQLALGAQNALDEARRSEKDLLLNYRDIGVAEAKTRYLTLVATHLDDLRAATSDIRQLDGAGAYRARTIEIDARIAHFERGLADAVGHLDRLGYIDTGLEGSFRREARAIETTVRETPGLLADLLQMRRFEKDFLLRARAKDLAAFNAAAGTLERDLAKARLPMAVQARTEAALANYRALFAEYVTVHRKFEASRDGYGAAANGIEPLLESVAVDAAADAQRAGEEILRIASLAQTTIMSVVIVLTLLFGAMMFVVFRRVARGVQASIAFAQRLAQGDLDYRLHGEGGVEFAALAGALNAMGDDLREAQHRDERLREALSAASALLEQRADSIQRHGEELEQAVAERTRELEGMVANSVREAHDAALLNDLNDRLQACQQAGEAATVISVFGVRLFPGVDGAVYLARASHNYHEVMAHWGSAGTPAESLVAPDECWGLRRGRAHRHGTDGEQLICDHLAANPPVESVCVPLLAQGESIGVLVLQQRTATAQDGVGTSPPFRVEVVAAMARLIALAIANLSLREKLRAQSIRDSLTGLYNRRFLEESTERELARAERRGESLAVLMIDADHFKSFNDNFGHDAGDSVLRAIGRELRESARTSDIATRLGGEEFVLLMPGQDAAGAMLSGERLRNRIAALALNHNGQTLGTVTVSVGVATFPAQGRTLAELLRAADVALYVAKHAGRNRVVMGQAA